jgi:hypothetical protein
MSDYARSRKLRRLAGREGLSCGSDLDGADVSVAAATPEQDAEARK